MISRRQSVPWLGIGALVLALTVLGWTTYDGARRLLPHWGMAARGGTAARTVSTGRTAPDLRYDVSQVIAAHLFGRERGRVKKEPDHVPQTKLRITLWGLIASSDERYARAIIGVNGARMKPYAVGQTIDGTDAALHAVEDLRVLIKRGSALESLPLKRKQIGDQ